MSEQTDPSKYIDIGALLNTAFSGFVHASAPHIMQMYWGESVGFMLNGMLGTSRVDEHTNSLLRHFVRAYDSHAFIALATSNRDMYLEVVALSNNFTAATGTREPLV